ncbi:MAG: TonB-dependent receptor plug domain-containing protein [Burkholderiales bacterium]|nr:TonB-dependent receptor plug domain-containing protein [Burkholderiales bacterium]MDR4517514.1 TonB-dependent receptor plug domain-containing protein [Nitrosomonas sp.]
MLQKLLALSLSDLSSIKTLQSISLTPTSEKEIPGSVTLIGAKRLDIHGFRDLNQALEVLVPGAHVVHDQFGMPVLGLRGEAARNRYLYVINGLESRNLSQRGTLTERDIPLLGDIQHIGVLNGAGGTVRGSGATSGLIDVTTYTGLTFSGTDVSLRQGFGEFLSTFEFRHGRRLDDNKGLFIYAGMAWQPGSSPHSAPFFSDQTGVTFDGREVFSGAPVPYQNPHLRENYEGQNKYKFHMQYDDESWTGWIRYVRGGIKNPVNTTLPLATESPTLDRNADFPDGIQYFYQQASTSLTRKIKLSDAATLELNASYDVLDFAQNAPVSVFTSHSDREDHLVSRNLIRWEPKNSSIKTAFGYEFRHNRLGQRSIEKGNRDHQAVLLVSKGIKPWSIFNHAILGEINWKPSEDWFFFAGGRVDFHEHAKTSFSPRLAIIKQLENNNTIKVVYSRAVRFLPEDDVRNFLNDIENTAKIIPDSVNNLEFTYQHQLTDKTDASVTPWWNWRTLSNFHSIFSRYQNMGVEARLSYTTKIFNGTLLHNYGATNRDATNFGQFFYSFPDNQSKLILEKQFRNGYQVSSSLVMNWSFQRIKEGLSAVGVAFPKDAYKTSVLWNIGLSRQFGKKLNVRIDGFNILALVDKELSRRNFLQPGAYWTEPASVMLTVRKSF